MMTLKNYTPTPSNSWTGRIDDLEDIDSFRMHQIIKLVNLEAVDFLSLAKNKINVCFLGFCCDEGVKRNLGRPGAKEGPQYIRNAFANLPVTFGENVHLYDAGDINCPGSNLEEAQYQLALAVECILSKNLFPIIMGGGHEIAFGHFNGIKNFLKNKLDQPTRLGIVNFDAHFDLRPSKKEGSSGTMFSQIAENCRIENSTFSYLCLGIQTSGNTVSMFNKADDLGVEYILAKDCIEPNFTNISKTLLSFIEQQDHIYATLCSDVFNSANAPGVSALQPFGMNPEVVLKFLKEVLASGKVASIDIAEVSPRFDQDDRTAKLAAVIIFAIINSLLEISNK
jgi:formiminoglutamase